MKYAAFFILITLGFVSCTDQVEPEVQEDDTEVQTNDEDHESASTLECEETLSAVELREVWEMMNSKVHHENVVCFEGYVLSNDTYDDQYKGNIAFKPFTEEDVDIPSVYVEFNGENGESFLHYEIGDRIDIKGKMLTIDNPEKHNFMITKCSLPVRESF